MRKTMTNEQKLLAYLYTVPSIKRKELAVALPDMSYQCLTRAVRTALEHGYVAVSYTHLTLPTILLV